MVMGSNIDMLPEGLVQTTVEDSLRGSNVNLENRLHSGLQLMLRELRAQDLAATNRERDLNTYRSGSAPPTVEGSLNAVGSLYSNSDFQEFSHSNHINGELSEEDMRLHPAYLSYYYSNENLNPRLPPPLLSKEYWRSTQRFQGGASSVVGVGDWKRKNLVDDGDNNSLFSTQPAHPLQSSDSDFVDPHKVHQRNLMRKNSAQLPESDSNGLVELSGVVGLGSRRKSFADILQEGLDIPTSLSGRVSRPASQNAISDSVDARGFPSSHQAEIGNGGASVSNSFASAIGSSLSRSTTPEAQIAGSSSYSGLPPVSGRICPIEKSTARSNIDNSFSCSTNRLDDITTTLSSLSLSRNKIVKEDNHIQSQLQHEFDHQHEFIFNKPNGSSNRSQEVITESRPDQLGHSKEFSDLVMENGTIAGHDISKARLDGQGNFPRRALSSSSLYANSSGFGSVEESNFQSGNFTGMDYIDEVPGGYFLNNKMSSSITSHLGTVNGHADAHISSRRGYTGPSRHFPIIDLQSSPYSQRTEYSQHTVANLRDPPPARNYSSTSPGNLLAFQKAYVDAILAQQNQQYELQHINKYGRMGHGYYPNQSYSHSTPFQGQSANSFVGPGGLTFRKERLSHFNSMAKKTREGSVSIWNPDSNHDRRFVSSLLDELKSNKTSLIELSDIVDRVVEFSKDQYGSRFIQQKLEAATTEEKNKIFPEIVPHARALMTDVFGNYVIQKFFELGTESHRKELASQLTGEVLPLSLQMYGCRVVQKALEVVDLNQKILMVSELAGSVMKCVRDQNGNHVIQKCIECVPQEQIRFIVSAFYGQVVALSTHPYGCRVIQRVLEHCNDVSTQQIIMDEIMQSVCTLAQDQYGNYVIQHVLEHGKPHERSAVISKLAGLIVKMSQQKFASNVVEKCLSYGGVEERQLLMNEMLGTTDENEPLQAMMKDPFGNYVVQKVLETCDDQSRELILSRIKVHLNTLKKYTYGKHIVSRVEKLVTAGERHIALSSSISS